MNMRNIHSQFAIKVMERGKTELWNELLKVGRSRFEQDNRRRDVQRETFQ